MVKRISIPCKGTLTGVSNQLTIPQEWNGRCDSCGFLIRIGTEGDPIHYFAVALDDMIADAAVRAGVGKYLEDS